MGQTPAKDGIRHRRRGSGAMTDRVDRDRYATGKAPGRTPDQAEGEREETRRHPSPPEARRPTPGQAEGDRATVEESLQRQERRS
jgi:hypothetical protein